MGKFDRTQKQAGPFATLASPVNSHVLAGRVPAQVTVLRDGTPLGTARFVVKSTQSAAATVLAGVTVILVLIAGAYLESHLRVLRRGRERPSSVVAVPMSVAPE